MHIDNTEKSANKPFVLKGTFNRRPFHALIDSGSPVTIFTKTHIQKMFGKKYKLRPLEKNDEYIDFSGNEIEFLGAIIGQVESGARKLDKVRALIAENGSRTVIGRDWLRGLAIKLKTDNGKCKNSLIKKPPNKLFTEFRELFSRYGRLEGHEINTQFKANCVPKQDKGVVYHCSSNARSKRTQKIKRKGPYRKKNEIKDDAFIQPTVITVKREKSMKIALDARVTERKTMNENRKKNNYQMPNLDDLLSTLAGIITR